MEEFMKTDDEDFINCAMSVFEEGFQEQDIEKECSCRLGLSQIDEKNEQNNINNN